MGGIMEKSLYCCTKDDKSNSNPDKINFNENQDEIVASTQKVNLRFSKSQNSKFEYIIANDNDIFTRYEKLGDLSKDGSYGKTLKMMDKLNGEIRAVKIINKNRIKNKFNLDQIIQKLNILIDLNHENLVKIYEYYIDEHEIYIVSEYCEKGDLYNNIPNLDLSESLIVQIVEQILHSLNYLNSKNIIHGDIKLENILIDKNSTVIDNGNQVNRVHIKIMDFAFSKIFKSNNINQESKSSYVYCSPEVLNNHFDSRSDIWSLGVIMYLLISGSLPFKANKFDEILAEIKDEKKKIDFDCGDLESASDEIKNFIKDCLKYNYKERPCASELLKYEIFSKEFYADKKNETLLKSDLLAILRKQRHEKTFRYAVFSYIVHNILKSNELTKKKEIFEKIDRDGDGIITKSDIKEEENLNNDLSINNSLIDKFDGFNEGIDFEEFLRATLDNSLVLSDKNLKDAFDCFDSDHDGEIDIEGLKIILFGNKEVSEEIINEFVYQMNQYIGEKLDFKKFLLLMKESDEKEIDYKNQRTFSLDSAFNIQSILGLNDRKA